MYELRSIIRAEIHTTAAEIRARKRWLRTPPSERPAPPVTRFALLPSKQRATALCTLMAHSRGRLHLSSTATLADQHVALHQLLDAMDRSPAPLLDPRLCATARAILARRAEHSPSACVAPTVEHRA